MVLVGEDLFTSWRINYRCNLYASFTTALSMKFVEREFIFDLSGLIPGETAIDTAVFVDCMQVHSLVNRISARQGRLVGIQSIEIGCKAGGAFSAAIWRLGHQWSIVNAWEKSMRLWLEQQNDTADEAGLESTIARYRDFKVHMTNLHADVGFAANLIPAGYSVNDAGSTSDVYNWDASRLVIPNDAVVGTTTERQIYLIGPDDATLTPDGVGLVHAYADSRSRPHAIDPNTVAVADGGVFGQMFDVGMDDETIVDNFQEENNSPPYLIYRESADEAYPGGSFQGAQAAGITGPDSAAFGTGPQSMQLHDILSVNANQNYNSDTCGPLLAPCGLICIQLDGTGVGPTAGPTQAPPQGDVNAGLWMKLTLASGDYQGVWALDMVDVN